MLNDISCMLTIVCKFSGVRSCYDEGKRVAETLMFDYHRQHGIGNPFFCEHHMFRVASIKISSDMIEKNRNKDC